MMSAATPGGVDYDSDSTSLSIAEVNGSAFSANGTDPDHLAANGWMQVDLAHGTLFITSDGTTEYKTDYIWFAVVSPRGIWDHDLTADIRATLSGYVKEDASRSIAIREIDSRDPWTVRFMVIAAKAEPRFLECFAEMKHIYDHATDEERTLAQSYLLEHGPDVATHTVS